MNSGYYKARPKWRLEWEVVLVKRGILGKPYAIRVGDTAVYSATDFEFVDMVAGLPVEPVK